MVRHTRSLNWAFQRRLSGVQRRLDQGPMSLRWAIQRRFREGSNVVQVIGPASFEYPAAFEYPALFEYPSSFEYPASLEYPASFKQGS